MRTQRPGPLWWTWYAFGGKLPDRHREWVLHDVTCRTWWLRHVARSLAQLIPVAILLLVVLGPQWITYLALAAGAILALIYSVAYIEETGEHRLIKHGYPVGTGRKIRAHRTHNAAALTAFWMQTAVIRGPISAVCIQNAMSGTLVG